MVSDPGMVSLAQQANKKAGPTPCRFRNLNSFTYPDLLLS